jgi:AraC-like DNA-binding protein
MARSHAQPPPVPQGFPDALATMDRALREGHWPQTALGGPRWPSRKQMDRQLLILPVPRMTVILEGGVRYGISVAGERRLIDGQAGQVLHFASHAWNANFWNTPVRFVGIVIHHDYLRVLWCDHAGGRQMGMSRIAHHTREPLGAAGRAIFSALDALADSDDGKPTEAQAQTRGDLTRAAWQLARDHLAADLSGPPITGARRTWQDCLAWLTEHLDQAIGRDDAAHALGIHPNYLSSLCSSQGGRSFQRSLEHLRLERAKALLRSEPGLALDAVAQRCGFASGDYLGRVFRLRVGATPARWARR